MELPVKPKGTFYLILLGWLVYLNTVTGEDVTWSPTSIDAEYWVKDYDGGGVATDTGKVTITGWCVGMGFAKTSCHFESYTL